MTCSAKECLHPCKIRLESLLKIRIWRWLSVKDSPDSDPYVKFHIMLSGVSAMVRPEGVGKHSDVPRTIADTLPLN